MALALDRPEYSKSTLVTSAVAGFFAGEEAISAMATVHLFRGRRWLGWYNSPGSYTIAKRFGQLANARIWEGLFPGSNETPAVFFGLDGRAGPKYVASLSGTEMQTGHLGYLMMQRAKGVESYMSIKGRGATSSHVAFLELGDVAYDGEVPKESIDNPLPAFFTISISFAGCIACALLADWYCFAMIFLGIISNGIACLVIGSGRLTLETVKKPAQSAPRGDGILIGDDTVIVVKGAEKDVNAITKGKFLLTMGGEPTYNRVGLCSLLFLVQFLLQLLLIPQGSLFGQIIFLGTFGVSWGYNSYLSSLEKEKIQAEVLARKLGRPEMRKFSLGTRTMMSVLSCLVCHGMDGEVDREIRDKLLRVLIPNDTQVWRQWRSKVIEQIESGWPPEPMELTCLNIEDDDPSLGTADDKTLLADLIEDAKIAFKIYRDIV